MSKWTTIRECTVGTMTFRAQTSEDGEFGVEHVQNGNPPEWEGAQHKRDVIQRYAGAIVSEVTYLLENIHEVEPSLAECAAALAEAHYALERNGLTRLA